MQGRARDRADLSEVQGDDAGATAHPAEVERSGIRAHVVLVAHHRAQRRRRGEKAGRANIRMYVRQSRTGWDVVAGVIRGLHRCGFRG